MKSFIKCMVLSLVVSAMAAAMAMAGIRSERITFADDVTVNDTVVKRGTYTVRFDDQTGELTILKDKDSVARAKARLEKRARKAKSAEVITVTKENVAWLQRITFSGGDQTMIVGEGGGQKAGASQ